MLAALNALTFWRASRDPVVTIQFFTGSAACLVVWGYALIAGRFSPLDTMGWVVLALCAATCLVWWKTRDAVYANLTVGGVFLVSALPTILGVWDNGELEHPLPWWIWTAAFALAAVNVVKRRNRKNRRWWLLLVMPIIGILIHGVVALAAVP
jgi:hypothetical protein